MMRVTRIVHCAVHTSCDTGLFDDAPEQVIEVVRTADGVALDVVCWGRCQYFSFYRCVFVDGRRVSWV